jgi:hypothetical protein
MKTSKEILERYLSEESADLFNAQRLGLLCLLPFDMAKPYLSDDYIHAQESGMLPEDETWEGENFKPTSAILLYIPGIYEMFENKSTSPATIMESLLYLKALVWVVDEPFHDELAPLYLGDPQDEGKIILDKVAKHFGWTPTIEDCDFEEIPSESNSTQMENGPGNLPG